MVKCKTENCCNSLFPMKTIIKVQSLLYKEHFNEILILHCASLDSCVRRNDKGVLITPPLWGSRRKRAEKRSLIR